MVAASAGRKRKEQIMRVEKAQSPADDRYHYDFTLTPAKGWAQIDTPEDAAWYGAWVNPQARRMVTYVEGEESAATLEDGEDPAVFGQHVRDYCQRHETRHGKPGRIDDMCRDGIRSAIIALGLEDCLHGATADHDG